MTCQLNRQQSLFSTQAGFQPFGRKPPSPLFHRQSCWGWRDFANYSHILLLKCSYEVHIGYLDRKGIERNACQATAAKDQSIANFRLVILSIGSDSQQGKQLRLGNGTDRLSTSGIPTQTCTGSLSGGTSAIRAAPTMTHVPTSTRITSPAALTMSNCAASI